MTIVKKECGKTKVEKRAQEVLGHQNGHVTVEKRAQEVLGQTTAMRWVEKEQKRKVKMKKTNSAALVLLLLWCLPCLCSAQGALAATNDTSPVGSPATGATVAVPWDGGTASPVVLNSNFSRNSGFLDGVINGIIPLYVSLNPPKFVWVVVFITSAFSSIWLGGLQQFIRKKHKRSVKRQAAKQRKAVKRTHADFAPNHHRRMCFSSKFVPCRYAGRSRLKSARVTCRRLAAARYLIRRSWTHLAGKSFHHVSPSVRRVPHFTPSQVDLLRSDVLSGGAGASAAARRQKKRNQDNSQTRKLLKDLKVCFNQGGSVPDLLNLLSVFVNQVSTPKKKKVRRSSKNPVKGSDNAKSHVESPPVVRYWKDSSGKSWPYTVDRNGWWSWVSGSSSGSTSVPAGSASAPVSSIRQKASSWVSSLRPLDWSPAVPPKLVPFGRIKQCLQQGEKINGNLVEIWSPDHIRELQTLWDVYSQPSILIAMLCGSAKDFEGVLHTRVSLVRVLSKMLAYFKSAKTAVLGSIRRSLFPWRRFLRFNESRSGLLLLSTFASPFCQIPPSLTPPPSSSKLWLLLPASQWLTSLVPAGRNKTNKAFLSLWPSCVSSLMLPPNSFLSVDLKVSSSLESIQKILLLKNLFGFPAMLPSLTKLITVGSVLFKSNDNSLLFIVVEKLETLLASCVVRMILKLIIAFVR